MHQTSPLITSLDWSDTLKDLTEDDLAYIDPPYIGVDVGTYKATALSHSKLVEDLEKAKYRWVLSEYANPLYLSRLGEPFYRKEVRKQSAAGQGSQVECLWKNL